MCVILGGGRGTRLYPLTKERSKPAVPLGGKYRLIDVPISNCLNSQLNRIYILTQYNSASLNHHVNRAYRFDRFSKESSRFSPPSRHPTASNGTKGPPTPFVET